MPAPLGHKQYGGRKKGTPNKRTQTLIDRAKTLGVDPFEILLHFASNNWQALGYESPKRTIFLPGGASVEVDVIEPELRASAAKDACQYLYPKRKAIEIEDKSDFKPIVVYHSEWGSKIEATDSGPQGADE